MYLGDLNMNETKTVFTFLFPLSEKEKNSLVKKDQFEDIDTITRGIRGYKGHVKLVAGTPIKGGFESAEELSNIIDKFIWSNYQMYPSTLISAGITEGVSEEDKKKFLDRIASYPKHLQDRVKAMYANAYFNKDK